MPEVGIRELKARASEVVRHVRESRARYVVTHRGRPVALITPLAPGEASSLDAAAATGESAESVWLELTELGEEIGRGWKSEESSGEILTRMRR